MKPRFTLRDVFWLMLVVGMGVGWWLSHQRAMSSENSCKAWAFNIAAKILKERTGEEMSVNRGGV